MKDNNLSVLKDMLTIKDEQILLSVLNKFFIKQYGEKKVKLADEYLLCYGDMPVCLVAHADSVHINPPLEIFHDKEKNVLWSPEGLGADDRLGIFGIMQLVTNGFRPNIIITAKEEDGGTSALFLTQDYPQCPFKNCKLLIELDRRGFDDMVFYEYFNKELEVFLSKYGFRKSIGSFSDVYFLGPAWNIGYVNLSIGYVDEHLKTERIYLNWYDKILKKVTNILRDCNHIPTCRWKKKYLKQVQSKHAAYASWIIDPAPTGYTTITGADYPIEDGFCEVRKELHKNDKKQFVS